MKETPRENPLQKLGDAMSDVSEECWHAGWMQNTEYELPELCRRAVESGEPQPWGQGLVSVGEARRLLELARRAGTWADHDERGHGYVPFDPWPVPEQILRGLERYKRYRAEQREPAQSLGHTKRDRSPSIVEYVWKYCRHLITDVEKLAYKKLLLDKKADTSSSGLAEALGRRVQEFSTSEVTAALASGPDAFLERVAERVLREHPQEVFLNRCPRCNALCRSPRARQCPECHHTWRSASTSYGMP